MFWFWQKICKKNLHVKRTLMKLTSGRNTVSLWVVIRIWTSLTLSNFFGLVLGSSRFSLLPQLPLKNDARFKSSQKQLEKKLCHFVNLNLFMTTPCLPLFVTGMNSPKCEIMENFSVSGGKT